MVHKAKIKRNDQVLVAAGKDRGGRGKVLRVLPQIDAAIVERVNMMKKHTKPNPQKSVQGGILEREAPIRLANLRLICPECGKATRVGHKRLDDGTGLRQCKRCEATFS